MTSDSHLIYACLASVLLIVGYSVETSRFIYIQYHHHHYFEEGFFDLLPLVGFYFSLAASFVLTILNVVKTLHLCAISCFVVIALELIRPIKFYERPDGFYIIALEILSVYPILLLCLELRSQYQQLPLEVTADVAEEKSIDILKENLCD